jgi:hypothetical protein
MGPGIAAAGLVRAAPAAVGCGLVAGLLQRGCEVRSAGAYRFGVRRRSVQTRRTRSLQRWPAGVGRPSVHDGPPARGGGAHGGSARGGAGSADAAASILFLFLFFYFLNRFSGRGEDVIRH